MHTTTAKPVAVTAIDDEGGQWIEPHRYQTNANLSQRPTTGADRPVLEYVTNVRGSRSPSTW
jgi:hypothetical protein